MSVRLCTLPSASAAGVLRPEDFTLIGYYDIKTNYSNTTYASCLTHRYVNGELRFVLLALGGLLQEFVLPITFGQLVTEPTRQWGISALIGNHNGIWWDEPKQRLWLTATIDYGNPEAFYPTRISTLTLNDNGTTSNVKTVSLEGITSKRVFGGVAPVPEWFQAQHGVGPYAVGFGGYTSLMAQTSRASLGPELICIPDVIGFPDGAEIPASACRVLLDTATHERGVRITIPINYFDGGDPRQNPSSPPVGPPVAGAQWLSPNADGLGWMVWGDNYFNTGMWMDGPMTRGFVAIASLGKGKCWYQGSTTHYDDRQYELHIWDPQTLVNGLTTRPTSMTELPVPRGFTEWGRSGEGGAAGGNLSGATYDPTTQRMYAIGFPLGSDVHTGRLFVYSVNS